MLNKDFKSDRPLSSKTANLVMGSSNNGVFWLEDPLFLTRLDDFNL